MVHSGSGEDKLQMEPASAARAQNDGWAGAVPIRRIRKQRGGVNLFCLPHCPLHLVNLMGSQWVIEKCGSQIPGFLSQSKMQKEGFEAEKQ